MRQTQIKGYRTNKAGKLVKHAPKRDASAAIARAKSPRQRYARPGEVAR